MYELLKGFCQSSLGTLITLFFGAIVIKILAIINGPEGVGLFSILRQFQQMGVLLAMMGGQTAIIQGLAHFEENQRDRYLCASYRIILVTTALTLITIWVFAQPIGHWIFSDKVTDGTSLVRFSSFAILFGAIFAFLGSVLNGNRAIGQLAAMQVLGAMAAACVVYPIAISFSEGYKLAYIWILSIPFILGSLGAFFIAYKRHYLAALFKRIKVGLREYEAKYFVSFALVSLITAVTQAAVLLGVRALILRKHGLHDVGKFDASWTLSMMYVTLILNSFAGYYLPTLSKIKDPAERTILIDNVIKLSLSVCIPLIVVFMGFKSLYLDIFYSKEFSSSLDMIRWMLLGDYFKVTSWIFSISMVAYAQMKLFFLAEMLWSFSFLGAVMMALHYTSSLEVIGSIFLVLNFLYLVFGFLYIQKKWKYKINLKLVLFWLLGLFYLIIVSKITWNIQVTQWGINAILIAISLVLVFIFIFKELRAFKFTH